MHTIRIKLAIALLALLPFISMSQTDGSRLHGLGVEAGIGHNSLYWSSPDNIRTIGGAAVDRTKLYLTPTIRMTFQEPLWERMSILPFFGYGRLGGKSDEDTYYIDALEGGAFALYRVSELSIGGGLKANYHLNGRYHYGSDDRDRSAWFTKWSGDFGVRMTYSIGAISVSGEGWFGISNLAGGPLTNASLTDNHYRVLIGYAL